MDEAVQNSAVQPSRERCPRCLQSVTFQSTRCEHCGQPLSAHRSVSLWIGAGGVGALLFLVLLMWLVVHNDDLVTAPVPVDEQTQAQQQDILPETSKDADKAPPDKPEKPPPLNQ